MFKQTIVAVLLTVVSLGIAPLADAAQNGVTRQVTVYRSGQVKSFALQEGRHGPLAATCDSDVVLHFTETVGNVLPLTAPGSAALAIDISVGCRASDLLAASIDYSSRVTPAGSLAVEPRVSADLMASDNVRVLFNVAAAQSSTVDRNVVIDRVGGQYIGGGGVNTYFGSIPAATDIARLDVPKNAFGDGTLPMDPTAGSVQQGTQQDVALYCKLHPADAMCATLSDPDTTAAQVAQIIDAVSPQATTAMPNSINQIATSQLGNIGMRLTELVGGRSGGFSASGLNLVGNGGSLSLGELLNTLNATDEDNLEKRTLMGGTRWGFWANGSIGGGSRDATTGNTGFDFDNYGVSGGVDYRFSDSVFAGAGLGYAHLDSDYGSDEGSLRGHAMSLHGYGLYVLPKGLSLDAALGWSRGSYDQRRSMAAIRDIVGIAQGDALGSTDTRQLSASIGLSWTRRFETVTFTPQFQYQFIRSNIDGFAETGCASGGAANYCLAYPDQHLVTRSSSFGAYLDRTFAVQAGVFRPYTRLFWYADSGTGVRELVANFVGAGAPIGVLVDEPDRHYGTFELGLGYSHPIGSRTVDFSFGAMKLFGQDDFDNWAIRGDVRIPF